MATEKATFNPYFHACKMCAIDHKGGINWSYATFETKGACEAFEKACNDNGYRTRNLSSKHQEIGGDTWSVQYHHYQD